MKPFIENIFYKLVDIILSNIVKDNDKVLRTERVKWPY